MMLCRECHHDCDAEHFATSVGPCELCGQRAECVDCRIHHDKALPEPRAFVAVNLNDTVRVQVTESGWTILAAYYNQFPFDSSELLDGWRTVDADDYTHKQLWHVMEVFGPHMHIGFGTPIETTIYVQIESGVSVTG